MMSTYRNRVLAAEHLPCREFAWNVAAVELFTATACQHEALAFVAFKLIEV